MKGRTAWLLPALLAALQLVLWPGLPLLRGPAPPAAQAVAVTVLVLVIAAALGRRRDRPVAVTVAVAAGISLATWAAPHDQQFFVPGDALLAIGVADLVALFSVAARRPRRTTVLVLAGLLLWQAPLTAARDGVTRDYPIDLLITAGVYCLVTAFGRRRARWRAERAEAAQRLAEATRAEAEAADAERRRLARELHDVSAHHLTSIVVNATAAQLLGDQRPELRAEALDFAARTGRDTLAALHRLVAVLPIDEYAPAQTPLPPGTGHPPLPVFRQSASSTGLVAAGGHPADVAPAAPAPTLADLADDFRQLGQMVVVELPDGEPPPAIADATHAIAREALTNTLRYAPGGSVRLSFSYGAEQAELIVDDDGRHSDTTATTGLGGGRGVTGMRERAHALGGTLAAARRDDGGWRVRAVFSPARPAAPRRRRLWSPVVLDVALALLTLLMPVVGLIVAVEDEGLVPAAATLCLLAILAHAAPLLWRRRRPWWVLAAVALTIWLGPLVIGIGMAGAASGWLFMFAPGAELVAVYAVAAWGARRRLTWLAPLIAIASAALALAALVAVEPPTDLEPEADGPLLTLLFLVVTTVLMTVVLAVPMALSWLAGHATRRRRDRRQATEEGGVEAAMARAADRARHERARVAAGLRAAVLEHAADVPAAADRSDLTAVVTAARRSLTAMRALLDGLSRTPEPTAPAATPPLPAAAPSAPATDPTHATATD
jgi:signal transduction histidine kinase